MIELLTKINDITVFKVKKREDISKAINRIGEIMGGDYRYICTTRPDDIKANGYQEILQSLEVDLERFNLIFVTPGSNPVDVKGKAQRRSGWLRFVPAHRGLFRIVINYWKRLKNSLLS